MEIHCHQRTTKTKDSLVYFMLGRASTMHRRQPIRAVMRGAEGGTGVLGKQREERKEIQAVSCEKCGEMFINWCVEGRRMSLSAGSARNHGDGEFIAKALDAAHEIRVSRVPLRLI